MRPQVPNLNVAFTGHVDHGKSTLVGSILFEKGEISEHEYEEYEKEAEERGKSESGLSYVSDNRLEERERGLSIKPSYNQLVTNNHNYTLIDCPGHQYYLRNMIQGVSQCNASVLTVDASEGVQSITKEHALISHVMGGEEVLIAITKMDEVDYDLDKFKSIKKEINSLYAKLPNETRPAQILPVSATESRNIISSNEGFSWFDGPSIVEALDSLPTPIESTDEAFRLPVDEKHTMTGLGTTVTGTVRSGTLRRDDKIVFEPSGSKCSVRSIEMYHKAIGQARPRDSVGINISGTPSANVEVGDVCGTIENPPNTSRSLTGKIHVVNQPPEIKPGVKLTLHVHSTSTPCEINSVVNNDSGVCEDEMGTLGVNDTGLVNIRTPNEIAVETKDESPTLSRFLLRDNNLTIAYGYISELETLYS